jgi:uncharacterized protein (DUF427 family)
MATEQRGRVRLETSAKRVRGYVAGVPVFDTFRPRLVWENPSYPAFYIPIDDVQAGVLVPSDRTERSPSRGDAHYFHVAVGDVTVKDAAWQYSESPLEGLRDAVRFEWNALEHWFEEDEEVFVHPRSPYTRIDILPSSRHVRIVVDGVTVADTHHPRLLFETGVRTRYYVPLVDVRMDLLRPSAHTSSCPYKGHATYWSVEINGTVHDDIVWTYKTPLPESQKIAGLAAFYDEHVDVYVDGNLQPR